MLSKSLLLGFSLFLLLVAATADAKKIRITIGEWPPYLTQHANHFGTISQVITQCFAMADLEVEFDFFPWSRSLELAKQGKFHGSAAWAYSAAREKDFYYSDPILSTEWVFFHLKENAFKWDSIDDLKAYTIGATIGYDYGKVFRKAEREGKIKVERVQKDELNFAKLLNKRIDLFLLDREVGESMLKQLYSKEEAAKITYHPKILRTDPLHLLLSKKLPENRGYLKIFNENLRKLKSNSRWPPPL